LGTSGDVKVTATHKKLTAANTITNQPEFVSDAKRKNTNMQNELMKYLLHHQTRRPINANAFASTFYFSLSHNATARKK
jgi:hypothetical protein